MLLRQQKRFVRLSRLIHISNKHSRITSIQPATAYQNPTSIRRPGVIALCTITVPYRHIYRLPVTQSNHLHIRLLVPDREDTVICFCVQQIASVGRSRKESNASTLCMSIIECIYLLRKKSSGFIESNPAQIVMYLPVFTR